MLQMRTEGSAGAVVADLTDPARCLSELECNFAGQIATAVWLDRLTDEQAREALLSYAIARHLCEGVLAIRLRAALESEYRHWRERQDLAS